MIKIITVAMAARELIRLINNLAVAKGTPSEEIKDKKATSRHEINFKKLDLFLTLDDFSTRYLEPCAHKIISHMKHPAFYPIDTSKLTCSPMNTYVANWNNISLAFELDEKGNGSINYYTYKEEGTTKEDITKCSKHLWE